VIATEGKTEAPKKRISPLGGGRLPEKQTLETGRGRELTHTSKGGESEIDGGKELVHQSRGGCTLGRKRGAAKIEKLNGKRKK